LIFQHLKSPLGAPNAAAATTKTSKEEACS
jgi:hypothetical protein